MPLRVRGSSVQGARSEPHSFTRRNLLQLLVMGATAYVTLPDILASWPWPRTQNPLYEEVKTECEAWIASFKCFSPKAQKAYDACGFSEFVFTVVWYYISMIIF